MSTPDGTRAVQPVPDRRGREAARVTWLVMATGGPALDLCGMAAGSAVVVGTVPALVAGLASSRPRLVILAAPPAGPDEVALVASERRRRPSLRTLLVNEPGAIEDRLRALEHGFDEALPTSISAVELVGRARLLASSRPRGPAVLRLADDLELDLGAQELRRDGSAVHLRPKELRLLALLATHPGRVYTRRQLLDRVWGPDVESDPRTVDVHVRWLRTKLEHDPEQPTRLITVRGIGYRLDIDPR